MTALRSLKKAIALNIKQARSSGDYWQIDGATWDRYVAIAMRLDCVLTHLLTEMGYQIADVASSGARHLVARA